MNRKPINWNKYCYTEQELREAVANSLNGRETLRKLGLAGAGGGYKTLKRIIDVLDISTEHWTGQAYLRGKKHNYARKQPIKEILTKNSFYNGNRLRKRLFSEGLLVAECCICKLTSWQGKPITLHLDHINGDNTDNRIENLRPLCPNCHSQTETYCGRNKGKSPAYAIPPQPRELT